MKLDTPPESIGDICWDPGYADRMLSPIAQVGADASDWFVATHSPIVCEDQVGPVEERALFAQLFAASKPETLVIVKGDPGAGKSQLINWLKLRFDDAIARGERPGVGQKTLRSVLIRRRSGSLKDALQQLVDQLPEFQRYLSKIQAAISDLSGENANRRMYTEMQLSLFASRHTAERRLRNLDEVFNDSGAVHWLCRPGGAIDRNVKRLTEESEVSARESLPPFTSEDFTFPANSRLGFDGDLKDRLEDDETLRECAAARATDQLRVAIAGLTGLRGHTLNEIFREIREEMHRRGEALALFVEDVSTLSVLDEELVNALQPLNDPSLCPLISVLGMTIPAYSRLPDNLRGRIDRALEITGSSSLQVEDNTGEATDRFVARYLNALRAGPHQARLLADGVRSHGDQRRSACEECPLRTACFEAFGFVDFDQIEVGLYPLAPGASRRLLMGLNAGNSLRTPRTLLQHVVRPLLENMATKFRGETVGLAIQPRSPTDLGAEQENLLAGWNSEQRGRLSYLLFYWTGFETLREGASYLTRKLAWFRHPPFAKKVPSLDPPRVATPNTGLGVGGAPPPANDATPARFKDLIQRLELWFQQKKPLKGDADFRGLLLDVVKNSIQLEEIRSPSNRLQDLSNPLKSSNIVIEDMTTRAAVASRARFVFGRTQEVYDLLRDLISFDQLGGKSWNFDGGAEARRRYGSWLELHTAELVSGYQTTNSNLDSAMKAGIRFLRLGYRFAARKELPSDTAAAVEAVVSFNPPVAVALSDTARAVSEDLPQRFKEVRDFLVDEMAVRQGGGGILYIDPRPFIDCLSAASDDLSLTTDGVAIQTVDYPVVARLTASNWARLQEVLEEERQSLSTLSYSLNPIFRHWGISTELVPVALRDYLESGRSVIKACDGANESIGDQPLQTQIRDLAPAVVARHVSFLERAIEVVDSAPSALLTLEIKEIQATVDTVFRIDDSIRRLQQSLGQRLDGVVTEIEVEAIREETLKSIAGLAEFDSRTPRASGEIE